MSPMKLEERSIRGPRPSFPIELLKGVLPQITLDESIDHEAVAKTCLAHLERLNAKLLTRNAVWRDLYGMTGTLRTFNSPQSIMPAWQKMFLAKKPYDFTLKPNSSKLVRVGPAQSWVQAKFTFRTGDEVATVCSGHLGAVPDSQSLSGWKIWLITTILEELEGIPTPDRLLEAKTTNLTNGVPHSPDDFDCVVVGGGFAGLCLSGRLKALGLHSVILERNVDIGDNWTNRYESARLHTSRYFSDFPFGGIFTEYYPYYLDSKSLKRGFQEYSQKYDLQVWLSTTLQSASYNQSDKLWTLKVDCDGIFKSIRTAHIVMAVGIGGQIPKMPQLRNQAAFKGIVLHSVDYKNPDAWKGKHGVVIGTANTGHDVAADMVEAGLASTTMVQRSRTPVYPIQHYQRWSNAHYNEKTNIEDADRDILAFPISILRKMSLTAGKLAVDNDYERFDALERAGFKVERYCDLWKALIQFFGGHYQDVGCSAKIATGLIKIKGDSTPVSYTPDGIEFSDGSILPADVVVFCTGFENDSRRDAARIFGPVVANKVEDCWGLDEEGEIRGVFKQNGGPGLWYTGGGVNHARFFSRFVALAIKADVIGKPLKVYADKRSHDPARVEALRVSLPAAAESNISSLTNRCQLPSST